MCLTTVTRWNDRSYWADDTLLLVVQIRPPETRAVPSHRVRVVL
jgi:hypothetical protein